MAEPEAPGVQRLAVDARPARGPARRAEPVLALAEQRMAAQRRLHPDLIALAGHQRHLHQRRRRRTARALRSRPRPPCRAHRSRGPSAAATAPRPTPTGRFHVPRAGTCDAFEHRLVDAQRACGVRTGLSARRAPRPCGRTAPGRRCRDRSGARRRAPPAVRAGTDAGAGRPTSPLPRLSRAGARRSCPAGLSATRKAASSATIRSRCRTACADRSADVADPGRSIHTPTRIPVVSRLRRLAWACGLAVEEHLAALQPCRGPAARSRAGVARQPEVEPHASGVGGDDPLLHRGRPVVV